MNPLLCAFRTLDLLDASLTSDITGSVKLVLALPFQGEGIAAAGLDG